MAGWQSLGKEREGEGREEGRGSGERGREGEREGKGRKDWSRDGAGCPEANRALTNLFHRRESSHLVKSWAQCATQADVKAVVIASLSSAPS